LCETEVGGIMAAPISDTAKQVADNGRISQTIDRSKLWQAQTPQMFRLGVLSEALSNEGVVEQITDEASAVELLGKQPLVFEGKRSNIKITYPEDMVVARAILGENMSKQHAVPRIGHGYDVHRFATPTADAHIVLGGVQIPHTCQLIAHSDGDVLIHALCDALLGAAGLGDIGKHFPDSDSQYSGIDSRELLRHVHALLKASCFAIGNADITVVAQAPKILPFALEMQGNLAADLEISKSNINIKATTTEKLGFEGEG